MDLGLRGKVALVFGAGGGLGGAIAHSLSSEGARVVLADIDGDAARRATSRLSGEGAEAMALEWDIADLSVIASRIAEIEAKFGSVSILVLSLIHI